MTIVAIAEAPGAQTTGTAKLAMAWDPPELAADNLLIQETYPADKAPMMCIYLGQCADGPERGSSIPDSSDETLVMRLYI